jgi:release factor glutamine methyltransferase
VTIAEALAQAVEFLAPEPIGPPRRAAESLLMHVIGCDRAFLHAHPERELSLAETERFAEAVAHRAAGIPLQYITGHQEFYGLDFLVTPAVLIPRPETEHLVESALELLPRDGAPVRIVDVGTGSGCIIISIAAELSKAQRRAELHATEISADALRIARLNAARHSVGDLVQFHETNLLAALAGNAGSFDLVLSNPPYVGLSEREKVQREVREHEPQIAVFGGEHGLDVYRRLIPEAQVALRPGGHLLMEIGYSIEEPVRALLAADRWEDVRAVPDLQGIPRVVIARKLTAGH